MTEPNSVESIIRDRGYNDFKWIDPRDIVVSQWVRMKCEFGCSHYGKAATCPPNAPTVSDCERFFADYTRAAVLHFQTALEKPEDRHVWTKKVNGGLLKLERAVFLAGYHKAFVLFVDPCNLCDECHPSRTECTNPANARPSPEAMAMDVFATVRSCGFPITVLDNYDKPMNRYGFLLIE